MEYTRASGVSSQIPFSSFLALSRTGAMKRSIADLLRPPPPKENSSKVSRIKRSQTWPASAGGSAEEAIEVVSFMPEARPHFQLLGRAYGGLFS